MTKNKNITYSYYLLVLAPLVRSFLCWFPQSSPSAAEYTTSAYAEPNSNTVVVSDRQ